MYIKDLFTLQYQVVACHTKIVIKHLHNKFLSHNHTLCL